MAYHEPVMRSTAAPQSDPFGFGLVVRAKRQRIRKGLGELSGSLHLCAKGRRRKNSLPEEQRFTISLRRLLLAGVIPAMLLLPSTLLGGRETFQSNERKPESQRKDEGKVPSEKQSEKEKEKLAKSDVKLSQAEVIAETTIFAYGGREALKTARTSIREEGTIRLASDQGDITGTYLLRSIRKEKSWEDLLRSDLELTPPNNSQPLKYVIAFNGASVWAAQNAQYVNPRPEVEAAFRSQLTHDYTTLLRYKEDGSKLEFVGPETVVGLQTHVLDLTTSTGEKTRYWVSARTFRILHSEYELKVAEGQPPIKFRVSYYPPVKVVANTLVMTRRVMMQDGKFVQEITLNNVTYPAKLSPETFQYLEQS